MIPYFAPRYPAFRWICQLCGAEGPQEEFITERIRGAMLRSEQGDAVFCQTCQPYAAQLATRIADYKAQRLADTEREIDAELSELVPRWVEECGGRKQEAETPVELPRRRGRPPKYASSIPVPNGST